MTKFADPRFNSPANNKEFRDNWDKIFGKRCEKQSCLKKAVKGESFCQKHLLDELTALTEDLGLYDS